MFYKHQKSKIFILTVLFMSLTLIFTAAPTGYFSVYAKVKESDVENIEQQIADVDEKISQLERKISDTVSDIESEIKTKEYLDKELTLVGQSIDYTVSLVNTYTEKIAVKEQEIAAKEKEIEDKYKEFENWIKMTYENGDVSYLEMIFNTDTDSFGEFLSSMETVANIMEYQNTMMKKLEADLASLRQDKESLEVYKANGETTKNQLLEKQKQYNDLASKAANYISSLKSERSQLEAQKKEAERQQEILNQELVELLEKIAQQNAVYIGGTYMWPAETDYTRISSGYGYRGKEFHLGIDIPADYGTNVYASNGGKVIKALYHYSYGNYILIDHGGGQATLYAHNSKLLVSEGDVVKKGDVIAKVGSTGYSTGNHVHFEVRINGVTTNPLDYVSVP
jgi:murein DD-endopeptidase MepM/ murein hydrolase activator NlpD